MKSFKQYLLEFTEGQIDRAPVEGSANIFTPAAGYVQSGREEFNPKASALVRVINFFPVDGKMKTAGEATGGKIPRETLHFTRNGIVSDHVYGNWSGKPFVTILPEDRLRDRIVGWGDHDTYVYGGVDLPHESRVLVHGGRLDDEQKKHITGLVGANDWDEAHDKIRAFDPEKGIYGHTVRYGQREITISGLTDQEMQSKTGLIDATHRHLHTLGIRPISIGQHYSVGYHRDDLPEGAAGDDEVASPSSWQNVEIMRQLRHDAWKDRERDDNNFDNIYGLRGLIQTYYSSRKNILNAPQWNILNAPQRPSLKDSFKNQSSGSPRDHGHGSEERIVDAVVHGKEGYGSGPQELKDVLSDIHKNPTDYHPTAYSHPEARAALKRQIALLDAGGI